MRCEKYIPKTSTSDNFICNRCGFLFKDYKVLVQHLYWRHGTECYPCADCSVKRWPYADHKCNVMPFDQKMFKDDVEITEVVITDENVDLDDKDESSDSDSDSSDGGSSDDENDIDDPMEIDPKTHIKETVNLVEQRESEFCICGKNIEGANMIGCDNSRCRYQWYHFECVGVLVAPEGNWYCNECRRKS